MSSDLRKLSGPSTSAVKEYISFVPHSYSLSRIILIVYGYRFGARRVIVCHWLLLYAIFSRNRRKYLCLKPFLSRFLKKIDYIVMNKNNLEL